MWRAVTKKVSPATTAGEPCIEIFGRLADVDAVTVANVHGVVVTVTIAIVVQVDVDVESTFVTLTERGS